MKQYLVEGLTGAVPFIVDRSKPLLAESNPSGGTIARIPGRFSVCDCINGNGRRYSKRVWENNLKSGSSLQKLIEKNAAFGLLEHPKDGSISLLSPISHQVTKATMVESRDASGKPIYEVFGEISLYNPDLIPESAKLLGLIQSGYNPLVSSRGYGTIVRASDGVDDVQEDYVCEGWDVVSRPSFEQAELSPDRSGTSAYLAQKPAPSPTAESQDNKSKESEKCPKCGSANIGANLCHCGHRFKDSVGNKPKDDDQQAFAESTNLKESVPSPAVGGSANGINSKQINSMELNEIRSRISALEGLDPSKLSQTRFAESLTQIEELHQEVAVYQAADTKRSWVGQKLHEQLNDVTARLQEAAQAPVKQAKKLQENNVKLMKVINAVASTALTYKNRLGESLKKSAAGQALKEELVKRGQGWKKIAESRGTENQTLKKDLQDSCEALDIMAKRYHEDTTELARRCLVLEFKEKTEAPAIAKALKEATRLRHIVAIREQLEGKKPVNEEGKKAEGVGKPADGETPTMAKKEGKKKEGCGEGDCVAPEPGKVTNESKTEPAAAPAPAQKLTEAKVIHSDRDPRSTNESIELVKRLSTAQTA